MLTKLIIPDANLYNPYSMYFAKGNPEYDFLTAFIYSVTGTSPTTVMHIDLDARAIHKVDVKEIPAGLKTTLLYSDIQFLESDDYTQAPIIVTTKNSVYIARHTDIASTSGLTAMDYRYTMGVLSCYALDMTHALHRNHPDELWAALNALYGAPLPHDGSFQMCQDSKSDPVVLSCGATPSGSVSSVMLFNLKKKIRLDITRTDSMAGRKLSLDE